ncbi:hypothetical protein [Sphingomonas sp. LaA6.9]|uniref:hypothetical protein n=1 Tax=Sphingomonas sp. LaA6.9 TaxID=2919914 RepID=UPI001F4F8B1A|nr:hypothetical protein [Sphingomonas sp. LaA6.9]MCJ8158836.1 hypothetical protein [Sphingomonas sp. LaA6.9]
MIALTSAHKQALKWMSERGGDAAVARVKGGGRIYLAQGEHAPFMPSTARALIDAGLAEYIDVNGKKAVRFRLTDAGRKAA